MTDSISRNLALLGICLAERHGFESQPYYHFSLNLSEIRFWNSFSNNIYGLYRMFNEELVFKCLVESRNKKLLRLVNVIKHKCVLSIRNSWRSSSRPSLLVRVGADRRRCVRVCVCVCRPYYCGGSSTTAPLPHVLCCMHVNRSTNQTVHKPLPELVYVFNFIFIISEGSK